MKTWLTVAESAEYAGVSRDAICTACERGELHHARIGGRRSIRVKAQWINAGSNDTHGERNMHRPASTARWTTALELRRHDPSAPRDRSRLALGVERSVPSRLPGAAQEDDPAHARLVAGGRQSTAGAGCRSPHRPAVPGSREHLHEQPLPETVQARTAHDDSTDRRSAARRAATQQNGSRIWPNCGTICRKGHKKGHTLIESFVSVRSEKP